MYNNIDDNIEKNRSIEDNRDNNPDNSIENRVDENIETKVKDNTENNNIEDSINNNQNDSIENRVDENIETKVENNTENNNIEDSIDNNSDNSIENRVDENIETKVKDNTENNNIEDSIDNNQNDSVENRVDENIEDKVEDNTENNNIEDSIDNNQNDSVENRVDENIEDKVEDNIENNIIEYNIDNNPDDNIENSIEENIETKVEDNTENNNIEDNIDNNSDDSIENSIEENKEDKVEDNTKINIIEDNRDNNQDDNLETKVEENTEDNTEKNIIVRTLINRKFLIIICILTFIAVCLLATKAFSYGKKVDKYNSLITEIIKKEETEAQIYSSKEIDNNTLRKVAAQELINCINNYPTNDELPQNVKDVVTEINNYYNSSINNFAFAYKDLFTGFTVTYNANQAIFAASSIKAPKDIYLYEMASQNKINLDEELTYTGNYYNTGSGVLKNKPINTKYTVRTLLEYSTVTSDNAAHNMLMDRFGRANILAFWQEKGTNTIFTQNNNWGPTSAHDALIYMGELYKFYLTNDQYGTELMNNFLKSYPKFFKGKNNENIASKSGWSGSSLHEMSIIFTNNPYILIGLTNLGDKEYQSYFTTVNDLAYRLHTEYWKYKMNKCQDINQY